MTFNCRKIKYDIEKKSLSERKHTYISVYKTISCDQKAGGKVPSINDLVLSPHAVKLFFLFYSDCLKVLCKDLVRTLESGNVLCFVEDKSHSSG